MKNQFKSGLEFENKVEQKLLSLSYMKTTPKLFQKSCDSYIPCFCRQYKSGMTIFNRAMITDFIVYHPEKWSKGLRIECKYQGTGGSCQDKLPKTLADFQSSAPHKFLLLIGGNGFSPGVLPYLETQAEVIPNLVGIATLSDLKKYLV